MPRHTLRSILSTPPAWAGLAVLALFFGGFLLQGPSGLSLESANTCDRFQAGGLLSPLTLDQSPVPELSQPYCGWPPLYMSGLCLLSLTGLPGWPAALLYNALITVLTGWFAARIARRCRSTWPPEMVFFLAVACPAYAQQFRFAYPTMMVPLCCLIPVEAALAVYAGESRRGGLLSALGAGLIASLGTWPSYMAAPALFLAFAAAARKHRGTAAGEAALRVVRWSVALGTAMVLGFILFKLASAYALRHEPRLPDGVSGGMAKFLERMMPGKSGLAAAGFFWLVRFGWVMLPAALLFLPARRGTFSAAAAGPEALPVTTALFLIPLLFVCFLPGEIGQPAHLFHGTLFIPLASLLPALVIPFRPGLAAKTLTVWTVSGLLFFQGYRLLPDLALENPGAEKAAGLFDPPGNASPVKETAGLTLRNLLRTTFKNGFPIPPGDPRSARLDPAAARRQAFVLHAPALQSAMADRTVALGWISEGTPFTRAAGKPLLAVSTFAALNARLQDLTRLGLLGQSAIVLPATAPEDEVRRLPALAGTAVEVRPVPGPGLKLLVIREPARP